MVNDSLTSIYLNQLTSCLRLVFWNVTQARMFLVVAQKRKTNESQHRSQEADYWVNVMLSNQWDFITLIQSAIQETRFYNHFVLRVVNTSYYFQSILLEYVFIWYFHDTTGNEDMGAESIYTLCWRAFRRRERKRDQGRESVSWRSWCRELRIVKGVMSWPPGRDVVSSGSWWSRGKGCKNISHIRSDRKLCYCITRPCPRTAASFQGSWSVNEGSCRSRTCKGLAGKIFLASISPHLHNTFVRHVPARII